MTLWIAKVKLAGISLKDCKLQQSFSSLLALLGYFIVLAASSQTAMPDVIMVPMVFNRKLLLQ